MGLRLKIEGNETINLRETSITVSYTHLDVYKRQASCSHTGAQGTSRSATPPAAADRLGGAFVGYFSAIYGEDLPHRAKTVYMYLKDRSNREGQCYPAIGTIARELQLSRRTVERAIADLERAGFLEKEQRWRENGGRSSLLYTLK